MRASPALRVYLIAYNLLQGGGWAAVFVTCLAAWARAGPEAGFSAASAWASVLQATSLLETVHAALGLVKSGVAPSLAQWVCAQLDICDHLALPLL